MTIKSYPLDDTGLSLPPNPVEFRPPGLSIREQDWSESSTRRETKERHWARGEYLSLISTTK